MQVTETLSDDSSASRWLSQAASSYACVAFELAKQVNLPGFRLSKDANADRPPTFGGAAVAAEVADDEINEATQLLSERPAAAVMPKLEMVTTEPTASGPQRTGIQGRDGLLPSCRFRRYLTRHVAKVPKRSRRSPTSPENATRVVEFTPEELAARSRAPQGNAHHRLSGQDRRHGV